MMSRKDYVAIAKAFDYQRQAAECLDPDTRKVAYQTVADCAVAISHVLMADNPRFDKHRFLTACGIDE